jgi:hypothetical protein
MLLREVLSDTYQPSFVEAADQQEHCSFKRGSCQRSWANFNIKSRYKMEQISADFHLILQPEIARFNYRSDERLPAVSIHYRRVIHIRLMR